MRALVGDADASPFAGQKVCNQKLQIVCVGHATDSGGL
jgi:hypothetical protein